MCPVSVCVCVVLEETNGVSVPAVSELTRSRGRPRLPCPPFPEGCRQESRLPEPGHPSRVWHFGFRVKLSEIVNHCFPADCLPLLIQVAISHSEYLSTNEFSLWRWQDEECFALTWSTFSVSRGRAMEAEGGRGQSLGKICSVPGMPLELLGALRRVYRMIKITHPVLAVVLLSCRLASFPCGGSSWQFA